MANVIDQKKVVFYLWTGLGYALIWLFGDLHVYAGSFWTMLWNNIWRIAFIIVVNFIFFEYTLSFVFARRRYLIYNILLGAVMLWIHCIIWAYGLYGWRSLGIELHIYTPLIKPTTLGHKVAAQMGYSVGSAFFFATIRHVYTYIKLQRDAQRLRIEKQAAELNYLRSQTNPHFLFNTLNNIYALSRSKSDLAPESILQLSKILRYMLYETAGDYVAIEQEIKVIGDYIALEQLRYDETLRVNFNYNIEDLKQALPPLLLIPLVENAFKHGVSETRNDPFVDIHLSVDKRRLEFAVKNSSDIPAAEQGIKENIGLSNLRRQLELLYREYSLTVQQQGSVFTVQLKINLATHV